MSEEEEVVHFHGGSPAACGTAVHVGMVVSPQLSAITCIDCLAATLNEPPA